jgi:hypothetical protein
LPLNLLEPFGVHLKCGRSPNGRLSAGPAGISGNRASLAARIQKRYDLSSVQAEQQIRTFEARCEYFGTVSSR